MRTAGKCVWFFAQFRFGHLKRFPINSLSYGSPQHRDAPNIKFHAFDPAPMRAYWTHVVVQHLTCEQFHWAFSDGLWIIHFKHDWLADWITGQIDRWARKKQSQWPLKSKCDVNDCRGETTLNAAVCWSSAVQFCNNASSNVTFLFCGNVFFTKREENYRLHCSSP